MTSADERARAEEIDLLDDLSRLNTCLDHALLRRRHLPQGERRMSMIHAMDAAALEIEEYLDELRSRRGMS